MIAAYQAQDYAAADEHARRILASRPNNPAMLYNRALFAALQGNSGDALAVLDELAALGVFFDILNQPAFAGLHQNAEFADVVDRLQRNTRPEVVATVAATLPRADFIPEGIAFDPATKRILVGSIRHREIVSVVPDGTVAPFVAGATAGLGSVFGMRADPTRNRLWVASALTPHMRPAAGDDEGRTGIWEFRLSDGAFVARHMLPESAEANILGDLIVAGDGTLIASESLNGGVYRLDPQTGSFVRLLAPGRLHSAQGMALNADSTVLYIADYAEGLHIVSLATGVVQRAALAPGVQDYGIDGLYRHGDELIAIQNRFAPHRVVRLRLTPDGFGVDSLEVLEAARADYSEPTLGVVVDDALLYVANSQWDRFDATHELPPAERLAVPIILRLPLSISAHE